MCASVLVRGGVFDRCNEDNILRITELQKKQRVDIWLHSSVLEITEMPLPKNPELDT